VAGGRRAWGMFEAVCDDPLAVLFHLITVLLMAGAAAVTCYGFPVAAPKTAARRART
jgi:hypothetical protein